MNSGVDLINSAAARYGAGDFAGARSNAKQILAKDAKSVPALTILGAAELELGEFASALRSFHRAVELNPSDVSLKINYARAARTAGDRALAERLLKEIIASEPGQPDALRSLGLLYFESKALGKAETAFKQALANNANAVSIMAPLSAVLLQMHKWDEAERTARRAVQLAPQMDSANRVLGESLALLGRFEEAREALSIALTSGAWSKSERTQIEDQLEDLRLLCALAPAMRMQFKEAPCVNASPAVAAMVESCRGQLQLIGSAPLTAVFFHVEVGSSHPFLSSAANGVKIDYLDTLSIAIACLRRAVPRARVVVITDPVTILSVLDSDVCVVRLNINAEHMMHARMTCYYAITASGSLQTPVVFLDTDVCVNRDLSALLDGSFDIGLTFRPVFHMPINEGVIMAASGSSPTVAGFFATTLAMYDFLSSLDCVKQRYPFSAKKWRGGQLSLAAFFDWKVPPTIARDATARDIRFRFLPADEFNYPVQTDDQAEALLGKYALHFKGQLAKKQMADFAAAHGRGRDTPK